MSLSVDASGCCGFVSVIPRSTGPRSEAGGEPLGEHPPRPWFYT